MRTSCTALLCALVLLLHAAPSFASEEGVPETLELGDEFERYERSSGVKPSPKRPLWQAVLLYIPNRLMDIIDIPRVDLGVGRSSGAVVRVTSWGSVAYRTFSPASLRVGLHGRRLPFFIERRDEIGFGQAPGIGRQRAVSDFELGAGLDLYVVGAYFGVAAEEIVDFFAGIVGFDISGDDW